MSASVEALENLRVGVAACMERPDECDVAQVAHDPISIALGVGLAAGALAAIVYICGCLLRRPKPKPRQRKKRSVRLSPNDPSEMEKVALRSDPPSDLPAADSSTKSRYEAYGLSSNAAKEIMGDVPESAPESAPAPASAPDALAPQAADVLVWRQPRPPAVSPPAAQQQQPPLIELDATYV